MKIPNRLKLLRLFVSLGFLAGIFFSRELWFPFGREFPRAPLFFDLPEDFIAPAEWALSAALVGALILLNFGRRSRIFLFTALGALGALVLLDQMRLQPWVYQYALLLVVFALSDSEKTDESTSSQTLALAQTIIAGLYFWSGVQKLNYTFAHQTMPAMLAPLENLFPGIELPYVFLGVAAAISEAMIGVGLLVRRTRNPALYLGISMHALILAVLIAKNYNSIVWVWNAALIAVVFVSFSGSDASIAETIRQRSGRRTAAAKLIAAASLALPALSFWGWWDMYLSGALYSGNVEAAVVRINDELYEKLPPKARQKVFQVKTSSEKMLPLLEWALADLNVPAYPEKRVSKTIARRVCALTNDKNRVELIVKERPAILDGSYKVARASCAELER